MTDAPDLEHVDTKSLEGSHETKLFFDELVPAWNAEVNEPPSVVNPCLKRLKDVSRAEK